MAKTLSDRKKRILKYIEDHIGSTGYPPTVREIGLAVDLKSPSTVHAHLKRLADEGLISRDGKRTRAIRPSFGNGEFKVVNVPLLGKVAAGEPLLAQQEVEGMFGVPSDMVPDNGGFLLEVRGDSMINAGIQNGDYVVVRRQQSAENGDIVVAMIDQEATVKRLRIRAGTISLEPENDEYSPIISPNPTVLGKVIGLFRRIS